jgi:inositol phosphorylceramide mannosyltransferase catalytic subunit
MIPRVIHRVWLGTDPMPEEFEHYGETWQRHHPDWEMRLWTDSNLPELRYPDALERCRNHGERSDILRSELLFQFGGLYVDTDVECKRPIEPLIDDAAAFAAWVRPGRIGSAVLGAVPGHPAIERLLREMQARVGEGSQIEATVGLLTDVLSEEPDVEVFDAKTFYPYHPRHNPANGRDFPDAYAVHHWGLTWKTKEDLRERVRGLWNRLEKVEADKQRLQRRHRRLKRRLKRSRAHGKDLERQLRAMRRSRWWRARKLARPVGLMLRRGRQSPMAGRVRDRLRRRSLGRRVLNRLRR